MREALGMTESIQIIRERPGMFIGDTKARGATHLLFELVANAIDQFLVGQGSRVLIRVDGQELLVEDDGPGFPLHERAALTTYHGTATVDGHAPHIHLASLGVGIVVPNALASEFVLDTVRQGESRHLRFQKGCLVEERCSAHTDQTYGTRIRLTLDPEIFGDSQPIEALVRRRLFDTAHLFPGLEVSFNRETFFAPEGLLNLVEFETAHMEERCRDSEPVLRFGHSCETDVLLLNVACGGRTHVKPTISSWVNGVLTPLHGTHVDGVMAALASVAWQPASVLVHVIMMEPQYAGPTKDEFAVKKVAEIVRSCLRPPLKEFLRSSREDEIGG